MEKPFLTEFFARRTRLITELQTTQRKITTWWAEREDTDPSMRDLAILEGMLAERKTFLERMMQLDAVMLDQLIKARGQRDKT